MADSTKTDDTTGPDRLSNIRPHLPYRDLREWVLEADKLGEIREVSGLTWEREIGMASEVILHDEHAPCVIFKDVPGSLPGSRVLVNFFGGKRQRMTLGFPEHLDKLELSQAVPYPLHGGAENHSACRGRGRASSGESHDGARRRHHEVPDTPCGMKKMAGAISAPAVSM